MFILPFVFAGVFMLTILNPHYTATLLSQAIPKTRLLGTAFSPIAGFLARSHGGLDRSGQLQRFSNLSEFIREVSKHGLYAVSPGAMQCNVDYASFKALSDKRTCFSGLSDPPIAPSGPLETLLLLLFIFFLFWYACMSLSCSNVRVPQPLSAAAGVEDFLPQPAPRAYAPPSPTDFGSIPEASGATDDPNSIPTQLEFVTPSSVGITDEAPFVVYTRAAIDAVMTLPARIRTFSAAMAGGIDEPDNQSSLVELPGPPANHDIVSETAQGIQRLLAESGRRPPLVKRQESSDVEDTSQAEPEREVAAPPHATVADTESDIPVPPVPLEEEEDLNSGATPQARDQPRCPPTLSLTDAMMFTVKWMPPRANSSSSAHMDPQMPMRGRTRSGIEEIVEPVHQTTATTADSGATSPVSVDPRDLDVPQSRPRNPPVTVWPRVPFEVRRLRMPSTQPMGMAASARTWDQSRRTRTMSGM
ncbi:hypothetical protein GY45DRAFT_405187 [Cubamyces sp. BRFM 1775]|nr:hypothetical protein GY45DRAFT_405187 [Cubamyces sp. BRFM 1775]